MLLGALAGFVRGDVILLLCGEERGGPHRKSSRITADDAIAAAKGLQKVIDAIKAPDAGHIAAWIAMPCTWGSQARKCNKVIDARRYIERSVELWDNFVFMLPNIIILVQEVAALGGDILFEWPSGSYCWDL